VKSSDFDNFFFYLKTEDFKLITSEFDFKNFIFRSFTFIHHKLLSTLKYIFLAFFKSIDKLESNATWLKFSSFRKKKMIKILVYFIRRDCFSWKFVFDRWNGLILFFHIAFVWLPHHVSIELACIFSPLVNSRLRYPYYNIILNYVICENHGLERTTLASEVII